ncbi:hypothetical protein PSTG_02776 [Puccinia striiformis f. sp. tritici PST-78]|uniref:Uncharacterized protein n=1 Tax=Puccinia striiformis f. sp. tritici PST-78 TaxID=1165861 RepID=A0A0L0VXT0_9BASI|nr:hypothetical protein PSTG_02776 [Puccinia striiformis f. sp. tritici PST-78]
MSDYSDPPTNTPNQYSEDDNPARTTSIGATKPVDGHARAPSTSSLSAAQDPDQDAEGETDDLDGDADGIKDDDVMDYSYEQQDVNGACMEDDGDSRQEDKDDDGKDEDKEGDNSGKDMDLDKKPPHLLPHRLHNSQINLFNKAQVPLTSSKEPLKLKLKLATQPAASCPPAKR